MDTLFKLEYEQKLRRICGVHDDSLKVEVDADFEYGLYGQPDTDLLVVTVYAKDYMVVGQRTFSGMYAHIDLMSALFAVPSEWPSKVPPLSDEALKEIDEL